MSILRTNIHDLLKLSKPYFADEKLVQFNKSKYLDMPYTATPPERGFVDLAKVRGTGHPDYHGYTWLELLPTNPDDFRHLGYWEGMWNQGNMKRGWNQIFEMRKNPEYYTDANKKDYWAFSKVGDYYYVTSGNHRTVLARFLLALNGLPEIIHGVSVTEYHTPNAPQEPPPPSFWKSLAGRFST